MATMESERAASAPGQAARQAAVRELISRHGDEFAVILREKRIEHGLPPDEQAARSTRRIQRLEQRLAELRAQEEARLASELPPARSADEG